MTRDHLGPRDEPGGDGGVDVTPGDVTNGLGHCGHGDAETQGDADILGLPTFTSCFFLKSFFEKLYLI